MWGGNLNNCPVCNRLHDDGAYYEINKHRYFVCFECSDNMTKEQIAAKIREKKGTGSKSRNTARKTAAGSRTGSRSEKAGA